MTPEEKTAKIRRLNDMLREGAIEGAVMIIGALAKADPAELVAVAHKVMTYADFDDDNDPHNEHDFGSFELKGQCYMWKIDYYDLDMKGGSPDPSNPDVTKRVLTMFYAEDY